MTVFYVRHIFQIGGVETFLFEIAKKYKDRDICIYYEKADLEQLNRLRKYVRCRQFKKGDKIKCDVLITNYRADFAENVEAKHYYTIIHADHITQNFAPTLHPKIEKYYGVSENACKSFTKITGIPCELFVNPLTVEPPRRVLHLLSATRLSPEKGKDRIVKLGEMLDRYGIPYLWTIFTTDTEEIDNPNIVYMEPRLDIRNYIADADYLVQLSSSEARSYAVSEALALGTPCIVSEHPSFAFQGVENGKTGYILPYDMIEIPIDDIYNHIPEFEPVKIVDRYGELIDKSKSTYTNAERESAFLNMDGVTRPENKNRKVKNMEIKMVNEFGNCIKNAKSESEVSSLERLGFKRYVEPKPKAVPIADTRPTKPEKPGEAAPKTSKKPRTRTVKTNGK